MGRKLHLPDYQILDSHDSTTNTSSTATECAMVDIVTYDITVGALVNGTMTIQYANEDRLGDSSWKDLNFAESTALVGATETQYRFEIEVSFKRVRLSWVNNTGTGIISAKVYGHGVGA